MTKKKSTATTVYKSNLLINARYSLKLCEHRVILLCLQKIKNPKDPNTPRTFRLTADDYSRQFRTSKTNAYRDLKEALDSLWQREVFLDHTTEVEQETGRIVNERWRKIRWVTSQEYVSGQGWAEVTFHEEMMPLLTALKGRFSSYDSSHVSLFQSTYSHRIYELLIQFRDFGRREFELEQLSSILELEGKYANWSDLRRFVIDTAVKEINGHSDIDVTYETRKRGRAVAYITFYFHHKAQQSLLIEAPEEAQNKIEHAWERQGYRSPGEYQEALELARRHGVTFHSAKDFVNFRARMGAGMIKPGSV